MNRPIVHPGVTDYVVAVRAQLDDLTDDELDELTGGLEADLDDALGETPVAGRTPREEFGSPAAYAAELRAAAGLSPRADERGRHGAEAVRDRLRAGRDRVREHPQWPVIRDFLLCVRPAWWVLRALLAVYVIRQVLFDPATAVVWVLLGVAIVVSVQLGRCGVAERGAAWRVAIGLGNAVAVLVLLYAGPAAVYTRTEVISVSGGQQDGVWVDGVEVRNIFPYDDQGRPLRGVQLYDQEGHPVAVGEGAREVLDGVGYQCPLVSQVPAVDSGSRQRWNVFPLRQRCDTEGLPSAVGPEEPRPAKLPAVTPGPLILGGAADATATPTPSPTAPLPTTAPSSTTVLPTPTPTG
jgi:hypothetical protein